MQTLAERQGTVTPTQRRACAAMARAGEVTARDLALALWPDSPAWNRRTRRGATSAGGALGATMPMKAGAMLGRMQKAELVRRIDDYQWTLTQKGWAVASGEGDTWAT